MKWASKQPVWGGLPGATLPCPAIHGYIHRNWDNVPMSLYTLLYTYQLGKQAAGLGCLGSAIMSMNVNTYISLR